MFHRDLKGSVFALGNFDGAHRGHRFVIDSAVAQARALKIPACVLTFEPHPRTLFVPDHLPFRLTSFAMKERLLKSWGVDEVIALPFTLTFAQMTAQDFVSQILHNLLGARHVVAGYDFTFGHNREGDMVRLAEWLSPYHVGVTEIPPLTDASGTVFSSTRIRDFIRHGNMPAAIDMLGHKWSISGVVIEGAHRGRSIGVPTANIELGDYLRPRFGVYAIEAHRVGDGQICRGVANIGTRPTVAGIEENLEAHLFDFDQNIYGQEWQFSLNAFIRPEQKFDNLDALKAQIALDMASARL